MYRPLLREVAALPTGCLPTADEYGRGVCLRVSTGGGE